MKILTGVVHQVPKDLKQAIESDKSIVDIWNGLTPLARNEWICWTITCKQAETREKHIKRLVEDLNKGKRRPCCWIGCIHRTDKPISPSIQGILNKRSKSTK